MTSASRRIRSIVSLGKHRWGCNMCMPKRECRLGRRGDGAQSRSPQHLRTRSHSEIRDPWVVMRQRRSSNELDHAFLNSPWICNDQPKFAHKVDHRQHSCCRPSFCDRTGDAGGLLDRAPPVDLRNGPERTVAIPVEPPANRKFAVYFPSDAAQISSPSSQASRRAAVSIWPSHIERRAAPAASYRLA
jgi:hypothetical protein